MPSLRAASLSFFILAAGCSAGPEASTAPSDVIGGVSTTDFPDVGQITSGCTATLIHPRAMLTASHCCQRETSCKKVKIGGRTIGTTATNHPDFVVAPEGGITPSVDVSILVLDERVDDIAPRRLAVTPPATGRPIVFVGFGCSAFGGAGYGTKRTGTNEIDFFGANVDGADQARFAHTFGWHSKPLASLDGGTPNDDANICPGDSGGPTFWQEDGKPVLAGVHTLVGPTFGYSCQVSENRAWIDSQLAKLEPVRD